VGVEGNEPIKPTAVCQYFNFSNFIVIHDLHTKNRSAKYSISKRFVALNDEAKVMIYFEFHAAFSVF